MRHLRSLFDLNPDELRTILSVGQQLHRRLADGDRPQLLSGYVLGLLFEKPSLRTRLSFEAGMSQLGGSSLFLGRDVGWGSREAPSEFTRVLGQYLDVVVCRAKSHASVEELASFDALPVINGLTDLSHPCQAMADALTVAGRFGSLTDRKIVFVGDGNNVARSLALICAMLQMRFTIAVPKGYEIDQPWLERIRERYPDARIEQVHDPRAAVSDADAIYTDVWTSMGQEAEKARREAAFAAYKIDRALLADAPSHAIVLHCLPAIRGAEIEGEVIDCDQSWIIEQAGNRMHAQKALLMWILRPDWCASHGDPSWMVD